MFDVKLIWYDAELREALFLLNSSYFPIFLQCDVDEYYNVMFIYEWCDAFLFEWCYIGGSVYASILLLWSKYVDVIWWMTIWIYDKWINAWIYEVMLQ